MALRAGSYHGEAQGLEFEFRVERAGPEAPALVSGDIMREQDFVASLLATQLDEADGFIDAVVKFRGHPRLDSGHLRLEADNRGVGSFRLLVDLLGGFQDAFAGLLRWRGSSLRKLLIEVDGLEDTRPPTGYSSARHGEMTLEQAFAAVGFDVEVRVDPFTARGPQPTRTAGWTPAEIHAAMESVRSQSRSNPLHLHLFVCSFLAGRDNRGVLGLMYDFGAADLNRRPREGVAVFYDHPLLSDPRVSEEARDREFVFTAVHEVGHALNLAHSFDKARPSALSWMNYPDLYPLGYEAHAGHDGTREFWRQFTEVFDEEELRHLRHATPREILPGGFPFGAYEEGLSSLFEGGINHPRRPAPSGNPLREVPGIELLVDSVKREYEFGEPLFLTIGLRNRGRSAARVPTSLDPTEGYLRLRIRHPDGRVQLYRPPLQLCKQSASARLGPNESWRGHPGAAVFLSSEGPVFREPGTYRVEAELAGVNGSGVVFSRAFPVRVNVPDRRTERFAEELWVAPEALKVMYLRHPLVDRAAWMGLEERARAAGLDRKRGNTTWAYLNYLAGLGWLTPFKDYLASRTIEADPARAWRRLEDVDPRGLPESVKQRRDLVEKSVSESGEARAFSDVGGLQPFTAKDRFRGEVPPAGLFGAMGLDKKQQRDPFARVVDRLRGRRAFADIVTWNIEHLHAPRNRDKIPAVAELIRSFRCDFWAIQEADEESLGELVEDINSGGRIRYDFFSVPGRGQQNGCLFRTDTTSVRVLDAGPDRFSGRLQVEKRNGDTVTKAVFHRPPLLLEARVSHGSERIYDFRTAVVHLKSTDSSLRDTGSSLRQAAARALAEWIHEDREETGERDYLILGDMNAETARQGLAPFEDGLSLLSVGMQERYGEDTALTRVASRRLLDHIVVTDDAAVLMPEQDENEQIIIRSDRVLQDFTSDLSDHVPVAVRMVINVDDD